MTQDEPGLLLSCSGRRVELMRLFQKEVRRHFISQNLRIVPADHDPKAPTLSASKFDLTAAPISGWQSERIRNWLMENRILGVIPLIDTELPFWAENRGFLKDHGTTVFCSGQETVALCGNKRTLHDFLQRHNVPIPKLAGLSTKDWIAKPIIGSSSEGIFSHREKDTKAEELFSYFRNNENYLVQEFIHGEEYSVDLLVNKQGRLEVAVSRKRVKTKGGEVVQSLTVHDEALTGLVKKVIELLPDPYGPMNIQAIKDREGAFYITEINTRFGGGVTLSIEAGANFPGWILSELLEDETLNYSLAWKSGYYMSRYDEGFYWSDDY